MISGNLRRKGFGNEFWKAYQKEKNVLYQKKEKQYILKKGLGCFCCP